MFKSLSRGLINWKAAILAVVIMLALRGTSMAVQLPATWTGGTSNWNNTGNWDTGVVPNNGVNTYNVLIDNGAGGTNSSVTLDINATIDNLTVDSGDSLNFNNSRDLTIASGSVINNGTINTNGTNSSTDLTIQNGGSLGGTGSVVMGNATPAANRILTGGTTMTHEATHTIRGAGQLLADGGGMINDGTIIADQSNAMEIDPDNALAFTNNGTMQATGTGGFLFNGGTFTNTGQTIDIQTGSKLNLGDTALLDGGTLKTTGTGVVNILGAGSATTTLNNVTLDAGSTASQGNTTDSIITGGLTNNGTWELNGTNSNTDLTFNGGIALNGTGSVVMNNAAPSANRILTDGSTMTHGVNHTIRGAGRLLDNGGGMINDGTIIADQANAMEIDPDNALAFTNNGTMQATGTGGFLFNGGTFTNTGQTIDIQTGSKLNLGDTALLDGGTLKTTGTGVVNILGAGSATTTLNNVTLDAGSTASQGNTTDSIITGGLTNNGTWELNGTNSNTDMTFNGSIALNGTGSVVMNNAAPSVNRILTDGSTMTHGANHTIRGAGQLLDDSGGMINDGTIIADQANAMEIDPDDTLAFTNSGTMQATGAGGFLFNGGTFTNTGQTIDIQTGSKLNLGDTALLDGGTLKTTGTGVVNILGAGSATTTLNNVTLDVGSTARQGNTTDSIITGGLTNNGTWELNGTNSNTDMTFNGGITLDGTGKIDMSNSSINRILTDGSTMTHGVNHTIRGAGQLLDDGGGMINNGTIIADQANAMEIDPDDTLAFTNNGTMQATGAGGFLFNGGTFTNTGQTIDIQTGSKLNLGDTALLDGGTLKTTGTGVVNILGYGPATTTLNNVTLDVGSTANQGNTKDSIITGGLTNNGTWELNGTNSPTDLTFHGGIALNGTGSVVMNNAAPSVNRILTDGSTMTHGANHTIEGAGQIIASVVNNGTIHANQSNQLQLSTNNKTNNGLMKASSGGTLRALTDVDIDGTGSWEADGGKIQLDSGVDVTTTGSIKVLNGGELELNSANMTGSDLTVDSGGILDINSGIALSGNYLYSITDESDAEWGASSTLQMNGFNSFLELGGNDLGTDPFNHTGDSLGFSNNFDLTELIIGSNAQVHMIDFFDNGNRGGISGFAEALYVDTLTFYDTSGFLNLNGLHLYYNTINGDTSQIIDVPAPPLSQPVPEPATVALLGIGLAGLGGAALRRRIRRKRDDNKG